jgi:NAD-dependent deacetylase
VQIPKSLGGGRRVLAVTGACQNAPQSRRTAPSGTGAVQGRRASADFAARRAAPPRGPEETVIDDATLDDLAARLRAARAVGVLTGAGISAESGVPTFRGADGLWRNYSAADLATPEAFSRDPRLVWQWYRWRQGIIGRAEPNLGHLVLAALQTRFAAFTLITQNVDGLHQRAGSTGVVELHGNIWRARCARRCGVVRQLSLPDAGGHADAGPAALPTCNCGALLRPDIVWFGESLDPRHLDAAMEAARAADLFLVVGTSALVYPAAGIPLVAARAGAAVVEINPDDTPLSALAAIVLRGPAADVLSALESRL